jgi:hypothetical protein
VCQTVPNASGGVGVLSAGSVVGGVVGDVGGGVVAGGDAGGGVFGIQWVSIGAAGGAGH